VHRWFPWIEGFSDKIPLLAIERHRPSLVFDPFVGSGTTAVTSVLRGIDAAAAEVNPFLRFVTRVKTETASATRDVRPFEALAATAAVVADAEVRPVGTNINAAFSGKDYFSEQTLGWISRLKGAIDDVDVRNPALRDVFRLALASVLIDVSNMTRRADLRRRRPNEVLREADDVPRLFQQACWSMIGDLVHLPSEMGTLQKLGEDARVLDESLRRQVDVCVTSPPYLNGTNYGRNTKLELWIFDFISSAQDLTELHHAAISAGINSARSDEEVTTNDPSLALVLQALDAHAYDRRITRMAAGYFRDMERALHVIASALRPGGFLYLDIGDSSFAGVHIPTDQILRRLAEEAGLTFREDVTLRRRRSKDGSPLRQALLIFEARRATPKAETGEAVRLRELVESRIFQQDPYGARNWGHRWHSMCSYQGKLKPSIAHFLVREFSSPGDVVLDPFAGSGAVTLEAGLQGRVGWANDINPVALRLLRAKASRPDAAAVSRTLDEVAGFVAEVAPSLDPRSIGDFGLNGPLVTYYHAHTFREILAARTWLKTAPEDSSAVALVASALAHILHGNRPYALSRRSHPITPFAPTGPTEYRPLEPRLRAKVARLLAAELPVEWRDGIVTENDVCALGGGTADVIITSPPFYGSTRFHVNNWIRLWFCGWEPADFDVSRADFLESRQMRTLAIYRDVFRSVRSTLPKGGLAIWHLGLSKRKDMGAELAELASPEFEFIALERESVAHCQSHGVTSQGVTLAHQFLLLRAV
jgi:DNA modification methylase